MKKAIIKLFILLILFFAIWGTLSQVNWRSLLNIEEHTERLEKELGELMWKSMSHNETIIQDKQVKGPVDTILTKLCIANNIDREQVKLFILDKDMVNAFVLPDDYLVIFTGLIENSQNEAELAGVIAHELAHISQNHVMDKLLKEIGLSVLISATTGDPGGETVRTILHILTSHAYSRQLEQKADEYAVQYLLESRIDPEPFANLLYRMASGHEELPEQLKWFSTHPDPEDRARNVIDHIPDKKGEFDEVLDETEWKLLKEQVM